MRPCRSDCGRQFGCLTGTAYFDNFVAKDIGTPDGAEPVVRQCVHRNDHRLQVRRRRRQRQVHARRQGWYAALTKGVNLELKDVNGKVVQTMTERPDNRPKPDFCLPTCCLASTRCRESTGHGYQRRRYAGQSSRTWSWIPISASRGDRQRCRADKRSTSKDTFGNYILGSIHGVKFQDFDSDGRWDKSGNNAESPWQGIKFDLFKLVSQQKMTLWSATGR